MQLKEGILCNLNPFSKGILDISGVYTMDYEEYGNPNGIPLLYVHGGPGACFCNDDPLCYNLDSYRIILFNQRSVFTNKSLSEHKINFIIQDIEELRQKLQIKCWVLAGGSWGCLPALAYAQIYPERCLGFILRGYWPISPDNVNWLLFKSKEHFPEEWKKFTIDVLDNGEHHIISTYLSKLLNGTKEEKARLGKQFCKYIALCMARGLAGNLYDRIIGGKISYSMALLQCYYMTNFNELINDNIYLRIKEINHLPCYIIHGALDYFSPVQNAYDLHKLWPKSNLLIAKHSGHTYLDYEIRKLILKASNTLKDKWLTI